MTGWMGSNYSLQDDTEYFYQVVQPDSIECRTQQMQVVLHVTLHTIHDEFLQDSQVKHIQPSPCKVQLCYGHSLYLVEEDRY